MSDLAIDTFRGFSIGESVAKSGLPRRVRPSALIFFSRRSEGQAARTRWQSIAKSGEASCGVGGRRARIARVRRSKCPDGRRHWLRGQAQLEYDAAGTAVRLIGVNVDIHEQKQAAQAQAESETRFGRLVHVTPDSVMIASHDGEIVFINQAGAALIEASSIARAMNSSILDLVAPAHQQAWRDRHAQVCEGEQMTWEFEIVGLAGTHRWVESNAVPLPMREGRTASLAVIREITARTEE